MRFSIGLSDFVQSMQILGDPEIMFSDGRLGFEEERENSRI